MFAPGSLPDGLGDPLRLMATVSYPNVSAYPSLMACGHHGAIPRELAARGDPMAAAWLDDISETVRRYRELRGLCDNDLRVEAGKHKAVIVDSSGRVMHRIHKCDIVATHGTTGSVYMGSWPLVLGPAEEQSAVAPNPPEEDE